jgi:lysophospholipase L1-like esterase
MQIKYAQYKGLFDRFNEALRRKAEENGVLLIDLAREIPPEKEYMYDVVHFTELGSRRVAEIVAEKLKPLVAAQLQQKVTLSSTNSLK